MRHPPAPASGEPLLTVTILEMYVSPMLALPTIDRMVPSRAEIIAAYGADMHLIAGFPQQGDCI